MGDTAMFTMWWIWCYGFKSKYKWLVVLNYIWLALMNLCWIAITYDSFIFKN